MQAKVNLKVLMIPEAPHCIMMRTSRHLTTAAMLHMPMMLLHVMFPRVSRVRPSMTKAARCDEGHCV
jgi:hypothetical protein